MTETADRRMTGIGTGGIRRQDIARAPKPAPMDPRRAPGSVAEPAPGAGERASAPDQRPSAASGIAAGIAAIREALRSMPATPGVYRMLDRRGDALYVGKARNLKSRVQNYTHPAGLSNRLRRMVAETAAMEI